MPSGTVHVVGLIRQKLAQCPKVSAAHCSSQRGHERYVQLVSPATSSSTRTPLPLLDMQMSKEPTIYEWQVLPFGSTCSPCCAIRPLQTHALNHKMDNSALAEAVEHSFYFDNCLHSTSGTEGARALDNRLHQLLLTGGFEIRQWVSNMPEVTEHLPREARSPSSELWLSQVSRDLQEPTLGLHLDCLHDTLGYRPQGLRPQPQYPRCGTFTRCS